MDEQRAGANSARLAELFLEHVVPVVADFAHCFEQVFELFVVEPRETAQGTHHDLFTLRVDGECSVRRREKRELEQAPIQSFATTRGHRHHRSYEEENAMVLEHVDADLGRPFSHYCEARVVESVE